MCVYSMVMDQYRDQFGPWKPINPIIPINPINPPQPSTLTWTPPYNGPTKEQFEEVLELLRAAVKIDKFVEQPECELEEKKNLLREHAKHLGLDPSVVP